MITRWAQTPRCCHLGDRSTRALTPRPSPLTLLVNGRLLTVNCWGLAEVPIGYPVRVLLIIGDHHDRTAPAAAGAAPRGSRPLAPHRGHPHEEEGRGRFLDRRNDRDLRLHRL